MPSYNEYTPKATNYQPNYRDAREAKLSSYFSKGGFNSPQRIGYVIKLIKDLRPLTAEEWRIWYMENVHNAAYLENIAGEMFRSIPVDEGLSYKDCLRHIYDVMFRRTFLSYNKEQRALNWLQKTLNVPLQEASVEWVGKYYVDFYFIGDDGKPIGIQLRPDNFYGEGSYNAAATERRHAMFTEATGGQVFVLRYTYDAAHNPEISSKDAAEQFIRAVKAAHKKKIEIRCGSSLNFKALQECIESSRDGDQRVSFPFIVQAKTGQKYIVWFTYDIDGPDDENTVTVIDRVFMVSHNGEVRETEVGLEAPFNFTGKQKLSYGEYLIAFAELYKSFSVNKMNSLLWDKGYRPIYEAYKQVSAWARIAGMVEKKPKEERS